MKKISTLLLSSTLFTSSLLFANDTTLLDIALFQICSYKSSMGQCTLPHPVGVLINTNSIAPAQIAEDNSQNVKYSDGQIEGLYGFKLSSRAGATINLGCGITNMRWEQNPFFGTRHFPFINVGISGYTDSIYDWFWQGGFNAQVQVNTDVSNPLVNSTRYSALLWGRYSYCTPLGLHFGVLMFTGINKTVAWPIIGFDWTITRHWQLNLVFPVNLSLFYNFNEAWSLSLAGRPFSARHRTNENQATPNAIFEYHNYGTELSLNYITCRLLWQIYGGYSYGNSIKFEDQSGNTIGYRHFSGAPYFGLNFQWNF